MTDLSGRTLSGQYRVLSRIGEGGMAVVYRAEDTRRGIPVAIKVLKPDLAEEPDALKRFQREAVVLERLAHPNIVRYYGLEINQDAAYIVLEFVDGKTLRRLIADAGGPLPNSTILNVLGAVGAVLDYAHSEGIVHRDVKPANIMVDATGKVLLSDFGIARLAEAATLTGPAAVVGSLPYMSPEQCLGQEPGPASDVYAVGVTLYEMLTGGKRPFTGDGVAGTGSMATKLMHQHVNVPPPPPSHHGAISAAVDQIVLRCLAKRQSDRYASCEQLVRDLTAALAASADAMPPPRPRSTPPRPPAIASAGQYTLKATATTPALIVYVLDASQSMGQNLGGKRRIDVVRDALGAALRQMIFRSTKGLRVSPRYRVAMFAYSDDVHDLLGGAKGIEQIAHLGAPMLEPMRTTETARAFAAVERLLRAELGAMHDCPTPLVCHMTDGQYTGDDPEPVARRIMSMAVRDGSVLLENIFISDRILSEPVRDPKRWPGVLPETSLVAEYARKLRSMSSPLPASYQATMAENGYQLSPQATMLLPGTTPELVAMGFQMSAATPVR